LAFSTYSEFQQADASEKIGLAVIEAARRLVGWVIWSGSVYRVAIDEQVLVSLASNGTALTSASSIAAVVAGTFYHDRKGGYLYARTADSAHPDARFLALVFRNFFANVPVNAPHDAPVGAGFDVEWMPYLEDDSVFAVEIENSKSLLGLAISSSSQVRLKNDREYWDTRYDKITYESHRLFLYSWSRGLPITQAKLVYKGRIEKKKYDEKYLTFDLKDFLDELRATVGISKMKDYVGGRIPDSLLPAYQRRLYGYVQGHVPTPVDQVLPTTGYPLTGTVSIANGATALVGVGTTFLSKLSPGDDVLIGAASTRVRIEEVTSDTAAVLSDVFSESTQTAVAFSVFPSHPKRYANREFLVAGHAIARPALTVGVMVDNSAFFVDSTDELVEGDTVEFGGEQTTIRVLGEGFMKLTSALPAGLTTGSTVYRSSVSNVYLGSRQLSLTRDYTYDAVTAKITLDQLAEFNVAPVRVLSGTITTTAASRNVVGVGTQFRTELLQGAWIKSLAGWYEVLDVVDDLNLILRTAVDAAHDGAGLGSFYKNPKVYESDSVLVCDALGKKDEDGNFIRYAGGAARDLLRDAGLEDDVVDASFETADELLPHRIGFSIPERYADKKPPVLRDVLNRLCRSVFASIVLNSDFQLEMSPLEPGYEDEPAAFDEATILTMKVESDSTQLISAANVSYNQQEHNAASGGPLTSVKTELNDQYLASTEKQLTVETFLVDEEDAEIMASRWAFLLSKANSDVTFKTKLQAARLKVFDVVSLSHEKLYERFGSNSRMRIGAILSLRKTVDSVEVKVNDLGNAFGRCARICDDDALDYEDALEGEKLVNGYMTDENGLTEGDEGINLIW